jgi:hypothetical protein
MLGECLRVLGQMAVVWLEVILLVLKEKNRL